MTALEQAYVRAIMLATGRIIRRPYRLTFPAVDLSNQMVPAT